MSADARHAIRKHSVTLAGHRTSLSLEAAFWDQLKRLADQRGLALNRLIEEIDRARIADSPAANLSSAVRVFVLETLIASRE
jgi:predicted DNA-binding ribbon-helix-helix protein